jgi:glutamate-1-semialdehyde 2,1-aminomutase
VSDLVARYQKEFPRSARLYERAVSAIAGGITHDSRYFTPFPIAVQRTQGAWKWDVDGHRLLDYWMGHGALLLGHAYPAVVEAVQTQAALGTHYGASHNLEVEWAELIVDALPAADLVRFVNSGSEATQLALRLARSFTGRTRSLKFSGHFHGWHDEAAAGGGNPSAPGQAGITEATEAGAVLVPAGDVSLVEQALKQYDIAAVLVEPSGGGWGAVPLTGEFLRALADVCKQYGTLLIFDEVATGFRVHYGGAQTLHSVHPDLTCLAKVMAGGLPGGAVAGRRDVMELLAFHPDNPGWDKEHKVAHFGTFNANPLSAAAGIAALRSIRENDAIGVANQLCEQLVNELNTVLRQKGVRAFAYGQSSMFHIAFGVDASVSQFAAAGHDGVNGIPVKLQEQLIQAAKGPQTQVVRRAMLLEGVDLMRTGGFLSSAHTLSEIEYTVEAFKRALDCLAADGELEQLI